MSRRLWLLAPAFAAGCLPDRDNRQDPAIAPAAALVVRSFGVIDPASCPSAAAGTNGTIVLTASRGACLLLDARDSTDPQLEDRGSLAFRFELPTGERRSSADGTLLLEDAYRRRLPVGSPPLVFRVRVEDPGGAWSEASVPLELTNLPPVAVAPPLLVLSSGGLPWAPGAPVDLSFDGTRSQDPDLDPLEYSWTLPDGSHSDDPVAVMADVIPVPAVHRARLVVRDGPSDDPFTLRSRTAEAVIRVGGVMLWGIAAATAVRFDPFDPLIFDVSYDVYAAAYVPPPAGSGADHIASVRMLGADRSLKVRRRIDGTVTDTVELGSGSSGLSLAADDARRLCLGHTTGTTTLECWDVDADGGLAPALGPHTIAGGATVSALAFGADGSVWGSAGQSLFRATEAGLTIVDTAEMGTYHAGVVARPGTDEVWVVRPPLAAGSADTLLRIWSSGGTPFGTYGVDASLYEIAFSGPDELWAVCLGDGLRKLDVPRLELGADLEAATILHVDAPEGSRGFAADPIGGGFWWGTDWETMRAEDDGAYDVEPVGSWPYMVDADQGMWFRPMPLSGDLGLKRVGTFDAYGRMPGDRPAADVSIGLDHTTGGAWLYSYAGGTLRHVGASGETIRLVSALDVAGTVQPVSIGSAFAAAPDGSAVWGYSIDPFEPVLWRVDLSVGDEPPDTEVVPLPGPSPFSFNRFAASSPDGQFVWAVWTSAGGYALGTLDRTGDWQTARSYASTMAYARSLVDNRACVAWIESGGTVLKVEWVAPDGQATFLAQKTLSPAAITLGYPELTVRVGSDGAGGEACWAFVRQGTSNVRMLAFGPTGSTIREFVSTRDTHTVSAAVLSIDDLWLTALEPTNVLPTHRTHVRFTSPTTAIRGEFPVLDYAELQER